MMDLQDKNKGLQQRIKYLRAVIICLFAMLLFRGWHMQIINGAYYKRLAENNRIRTVTLPPLRGIIYDRHGEVLANIGLSAEDIKERIASGKDYDPFSPVIIKEGLSMREVALIESHAWNLPGIGIFIEGRREYPNTSLAAHLLGYVGEITPSQLKGEEYAGEPLGRIVGQNGVEKVYDRFLRGGVGKKNIEVDAAGHERRVLNVIEPVSGDSIILSIDHRLQKTAEEALGGRPGAVVVMDTGTGEVLALVSHPAFDPNVLSRRLSPKVWQKIAENPAHPLNNRAIQGKYPPGSVFKIIMASAGLEEGYISEDHKISCNGGMSFGRRVFRDWKPEGHGIVDLHKAITESCDVYFYQLGNRMQIDTIAKYASLFGLGELTGIDLPSEKKGLVPSTQWKIETKKERWYPGETLSVSIGQGSLSVTPLQQAVTVNTLANSGVVVRPRILRALISDREKRLFAFPPVEMKRINIQEHTLDVIKKGLYSVVNDPGGTGSAARSPFVDIAGKTGTAQVIGRRSEGNQPHGFNDHAWFVAFAPVKKPEITVAVLVEHGGHGGSAAAPAARQIIEEYVKNKGSRIQGVKGSRVREVEGSNL
ncbi:MAG: penicillin-binding protein 2 [Nitrospirae bacterium]|nr:penicillin-binding protein 2 [Nitrospirota bacterium]